MTDTIIIGGGASGMAAAVAAARAGDSVLILERMDRVGKKLLATGNGKCNLMNRNPLAYGGNSAFAEHVFRFCTPRQLETFLNSMGLQVRPDEMGRVYPVSGQASSVLDAFRFELEREKVQIRPQTEITKAVKENDYFTVYAESDTFSCRRLIVATGGKTQPKLGSNGSGYRLLKSFGHSVGPLLPGLTQLEADADDIKGLSGMRVRCQLRLEEKGKTVFQDRGEVLFTDYGISGICVMQASSRINGDKAEMVLCLTQAAGFENPELFEKEIRQRVATWQNDPLERLLTGLLLPRLSLRVMYQAGIQAANRTCASLRDDEIRALVQTVSAYRVRIRGRRGFETAQVTRGGARCEAFSPENMESLLVSGLHATGEVLDVDGDCGGYNLMFAFAGGILAGSNRRNVF